MGTNVIRRKKKLISLIWLIWSKQNKSHSSIGYQPYCDLFYILVIRSFFEINFFFTPLIFFYTSCPGTWVISSIFRKISNFEFRSSKQSKKLVWCVKLVCIIGFGLVLSLEYSFLMEMAKFFRRIAIFTRNLKKWHFQKYLENEVIEILTINLNLIFIM